MEPTPERPVLSLPEAFRLADLDRRAVSGTRELMGRIRHASMRAALIYQHRKADRDRAIADALDALIGRVEGTTP